VLGVVRGTVSRMLGSLLRDATSDTRLRSQRLTDAASEALQRVRLHVLSAPFAPVGETLVWLIALEDLLVAACNSAGLNYWQQRNADSDGAVLPGIRYVRNAAVHGELVVTITVVNPGAVLGAAALGTFAPGQGPSAHWQPRALLRHAPKTTPHLAQQQASYDSHIAGRAVTPPLELAFDFLRDAAR
jgi:hypothetical protein